jgi:ATP-binding cassette subfamily F protein uup
MALIGLKEISIAFGGPALLDGVTLQIGRGERVCLVGRNGAGKSTLLRICCGELRPDSGEVARREGIKTAYLPQEAPRDLTGSVFDLVSAGLGGVVDLLAEYHDLSIRLAHEGTDRLMSELERVQSEIERLGGWQMNLKVESVLSRLGLAPEAAVNEMSGGNIRKVLLAKALVDEPDLLLLDEPTNHLDISSIEWLEEALRQFRGAVLFVTHDRRFLRNLATRILDLDRGRVTDWPGDYETYLKRRQSELDAEETRNSLFDKRLAQEESWIRRGIKARRTRNEGRVRVLEEMRRERLARREQEGSASLRLNEARRSGRLVIEAEGVCFGYGDRPVIRDFSTVIMRGDKIGIIGPNGSGKTTLLNILLGGLEPLQGSVRRGVNLEPAYFDQQRMQLDEDRSVIDNVGEGSEQVTVNGKARHIVGYLEDFLFSPERARMPVKTLSGGEKNRALLAKLFTRPSNALVLDEPTNDLDIDTLELLEETLMEYRGTVLLVSHDREFLDNLVASVIAFEGEGRLTEYVGGYDDRFRQRGPAAAEPPAKAEKAARPERERPRRERPRVLTFNEKRELAALPARIEALEAERARIYETLADPDFYRREGGGLSEAKARLEELEAEIPAAYARWEELEAVSDGRDTGDA